MYIFLYCLSTLALYYYNLDFYSELQKFISQLPASPSQQLESRAALSKEVLAEIPGQLCELMRHRALAAGAPAPGPI